jgi:hypothetical protein
MLILFPAEVLPAAIGLFRAMAIVDARTSTLRNQAVTANLLKGIKKVVNWNSPKTELDAIKILIARQNETNRRLRLLLVSCRPFPSYYRC